MAFTFADEDAGRGVTVHFEPAELTVAPGQTASLTVILRLDPTRMRPWTMLDQLAPGTMDVRTAAGIETEDEMTALEVDGWVTIEETSTRGASVEGGDEVVVPLYSLPRRNACVEADGLEPFSLTRTDASFEQVWYNDCLTPAQVEVLPLVGTDPEEPEVPDEVDIEAVGLRWDLADPSDPNGDIVLEWQIKTRGTRRIPYEGHFIVLFDSNLDGRWDWSVFNLMGEQLAAQTPNLAGLPAGRWYTAHAPVQSGSSGIGPTYSQSSLPVFEQAYNLNENTTRLLASADKLGLDGAFRTGEARFRWAVVVQDLAQDYALTETFRGYDQAPASLDARAGFLFDQQQVGCLQMSDASGSLPVSAASRWLTLGPLGDARVTFGLSCDPGDGGEMGLLFNYPANVPGDASAEIRPGIVGRRAAEIYLPVAATGAWLSHPPGLQVDLHPVSAGGPSGAAWLEEQAADLAVEVRLASAVSGGPLGARIHAGTCANPRDTVYELADVVDGRSSSRLTGVSEADLTTTAHSLALAAPDGTTLACGGIVPDLGVITP
jgi:hypothetical protein